MEQRVIRQLPLVELVYRDLKKRIVTGKLSPNAKLGTRELCQYYGTSDTPLKQALHRLVSEGLVEARHHRGMRVKEMTPKDIHESIEARLMIEQYAVAPSLENVRNGGELLPRLDRSLREDEALIAEAEDLGTYSDLAQRELEVSQEFHTLMIAATGNQLIVATYRNIVNHTYFYYQAGLNKTSQAISSLAEHKEILARLRTLDEDGLRRAIREHLRTRERAVTAAFGGRSRPGGA
ncbi:MAG: GntR family transcriptional regulator [Planctomycetota bacterium]|jgi:DNA-binding GntR family transcriptional regulator|nr:GntR family transcriptional regulator [Planctomycetota bacterium]